MAIGKIPTTPQVNQVAPNQRVTRFDEIKDVRGPFPNPAKNEFGFWFNYFWAEAVELEKLTAAQKSKLSDTFFSVFADQQSNVWQLRPDFAARDDAWKENVLRQLLLIGFRRVAVSGPVAAPRAQVGGRPFQPTLRAELADALKLQMLPTASGATGTQELLPLAFRSDARTYDELVQSNGFRARARETFSKVWYEHGLDQRWHPYNNPVYADSLWLRQGLKNKDNCLHTVVSVGSVFKKITHFPILSDHVLVFDAKDARGAFLAMKPLDTWTPQDELAAAGHWCKVRAARDPHGAIDHLEKDIRIYAFHLRGVHGYNTETHFGGNDAFPERGVSSVPVGNFLAEFNITQKWWFNGERNMLVLYDLDFHSTRLLPNELYVTVVLGSAGRLALEAKMLQWKNEALAELTAEKQRFLSYKAALATRLSSGEMDQVLQAMRQRVATTGYKPNAAADKKELTVKLPLLAAKIGALGPLELTALRKGQRPY